MKLKINLPIMAALMFIFASCTTNSSDSNKIENLAESWVRSSYESKDAAYNMVSENMNSDGYNIGARYIGFGFNFNSDIMETDGYGCNKRNRRRTGISCSSSWRQVCFSKWSESKSRGN